jgi:uncharacterized damage-inducible protein DinB
MARAKFPPGWNEERVQNVLAHYETQSEDEALVEDEAAFETEGDPEQSRDTGTGRGVTYDGQPRRRGRTTVRRNGRRSVLELAFVGALYRYNSWANEEVLTAVSRASPADFTRDLKSSHRSMRDTLTHLVWAEWIWLQRWKGTSPMEVFSPDDFPTVDSLADRFRAVAAERSGFLEGLTAEALSREIEYRNLKGETWRYPLWQQLHHVVNHSTYHRGQVITMLRQVGESAPATDFLVYYDQGGR